MRHFLWTLALSITGLSAALAQVQMTPVAPPSGPGYGGTLLFENESAIVSDLNGTFVVTVPPGAGPQILRGMSVTGVAEQQAPGTRALEESAKTGIEPFENRGVVPFYSATRDELLARQQQSAQQAAIAAQPAQPAEPATITCNCQCPEPQEKAEEQAADELPPSEGEPQQQEPQPQSNREP